MKLTLGIIVKVKKQSMLERLGDKVFGIWANNALGVIVLMSAVVFQILKSFDIAIGITILALVISISRLVFIRQSSSLGTRVFNVALTVVYLIVLILLKHILNAKAAA